MARRLLSLVGRAKVTTSDDAGPIQTLQGKFNDLEVIDGMPRAAELGLRLACPLAPILWWCFSTVTAPMAWCWEPITLADLGT